MQPKIAMELMRHSSMDLTMKIYSHTTINDKRKALEKLPEIPSPGKEFSVHPNVHLCPPFFEQPEIAEEELNSKEKSL